MFRKNLLNNFGFDPKKILEHRKKIMKYDYSFPGQQK